MGHATLERVLLFGTRSADYIRASGHSGCIATEVILQAITEAEYMTAPERFAEKSDSLLHRGRRPYMTHSVISVGSFAVVHNRRTNGKTSAGRECWARYDMSCAHLSQRLRIN
jgi:hypothetical protein